MEYKPPYFLFNGHLETIFPFFFRKVIVPYQRERIKTSDDDFLDLDWLRQSSDSLVIISHGLEGNSRCAYVQGMARAFFHHHFDVLSWNYRSCSEEMNRQLRFYHSGATDDLDNVIQHAIAQFYKKIYLIGFSLGGNITLKYLGEKNCPEQIKKSFVVSVPLHLRSCCKKLSQFSNFLYTHRFLKSLKEKVKKKALLRKDLNISGIHFINNLFEFDNEFTAPLHGFKNAEEYYEKNSSLFFISNISIPTLIVNARNDHFLSEECYPQEMLINHPFILGEYPIRGGHVGFVQFNQNGLYWSEQRALSFILS